VISLRTLAGAIRTLGLIQPFWWLLYRYQLGSGTTAIRTPLRAWEDLGFKDCIRPGAEAEASRYLDGQAAPRLTFGEARQLAPLLADLMGPSLQSLVDEVVLTSTGRFRLWEDSFRACGMPPAWNRNPLTGREQDASIHWTTIAERETGDVKGLWELSRFAVAFRLTRLYAATGDQRAAELFVRLADSWLKANPPNAGPQWISGQEVALRAIAWVFAVSGLWGAAALGREVRSQLVVALREHGRRIMATLAYARAQGNNHLLSEAAALWTLGLALPWMREAERWANTGRSILIAAARRQIEPDGGYIQHSTNYQRLAADVLVWSLRLGEVHARRFPEETYDRLRAMRDCLSQLVGRADGRAPNLGHNDGSLALPITTCAFEDFRPVLQSLSLVCDGRREFSRGPWDEEALWLLGALPAEELARTASAPPVPRVEARGGMIALSAEPGHGFLRAPRFHNRPAHADLLHADLWLGGFNFACDAGTYLYGGEPPWENALASSGHHNTVTVDNLDQMERAGRFLWIAEDAHTERLDVRDRWALAVASHKGYRRLGVIHRRAMIGFDGRTWVIVDDLLGTGTHALRLHWLAPDGQVADVHDADERTLHLEYAWKERRARASIWAGQPFGWDVARAGEILLARGDGDAGNREVRGWRSLCYANREPALSLAVRTTAALPARFITIWDMNSPAARMPTVHRTGIHVDLGSGSLRLNRLGLDDPIAEVTAASVVHGAG
jgi:Heparinase II/III-like protein/Heparinase II/III N-terminus